MENQATTKNPATEEQTFPSGNTELELRIKKDADHLFRWLYGTANCFVSAMHKLADKSEDREKFLTGVTERIIGDIDSMIGMVRTYEESLPKEENKEEDTENDKEEDVEEEMENETEKEVEDKETDLEELSMFYHKTISIILSTNMEQLDSMRLALKSRRFVAKDDEEFGQFVRDFVMYRIARSRYMLTAQRSAYLLCIIVALSYYKYEEMGSHGEFIKEIIDELTVSVCMIITKDYEEKKRMEEEFMAALDELADEDDE